MTTTTLPARAISAKLAAEIAWFALTLVVAALGTYALALIHYPAVESGFAMFAGGALWWEASPYVLDWLERWMYGGKVQRWLRR